MSALLHILYNFLVISKVSKHLNRDCVKKRQKRLEEIEDEARENVIEKSWKWKILIAFPSSICTQIHTTTFIMFLE